MTRTIRSAFVMAVVMTAVACGGASASEDIVAGQSPLSQKKGDDTKPTPDDCTKPEPGDPNPGGDCTWWGDGNDTSCKSPDVWKDEAWKACSAKGGTLTDIAFGDVCTDGNVRFAKYQCCTASEQPKEPGDPPPTSSCIPEYANNACQGEAAWKDHAYQVCAKQGLSLGDVGYGSVCGKNGEVSEIKFSCCK